MDEKNLTLPEREPVAIVGAVSAALGATLTVLAHWLPITSQLKDEITTAFGLWAVALVIVVPIIRQMVTPNGKVVAQVQGADVVAGPAHPMETGTVLMPADETPPGQ